MYTQSVDQIIQKAINVEKEGADFYRKLAGEVSVEAIKNVFLGFVSDEIKHQEDFHAFAKTMKGVVVAASFDILERMTSVTTRLQGVIKGSEPIDLSEINLSQAIKIAVYNEEESIRIYSSLLEIANVEFNAVIRKIIAEEKEHLAALERMKRYRLG